MLHIVSADLAHRTIARLFGAYDVVIVDLPMIVAPKGARLPYQPADMPLANLVEGIAQQTGQNVVAFAPSEDRLVAGGDPLALHVLAGLNHLDDERRSGIIKAIAGYPREKEAATQRLLVLTDSLFLSDEPHGWAASPDVALVHIEGY